MSLFGIDLESLLSQANANQTQGGASGVNRGPPAVAPTIPIPANQNPNATGYMGQAFRLAGVPVAPPAQAPTQQAGQQPATQIDPMLAQYLQALMGNGQGGGTNPLYLQHILSALQGL